VIGQGPAWNHSLSVWLASDPHRGAGLLLRDDDSRRIVERLEPGTAKSAEAYDTALRRRCISCHATATPEQCAGDGLLSDADLGQGVACDSCHGDSQRWLEPHVRADWSGPQRFEPDGGMIDTESIAGRAASCVRCHVGSRTADGLVRDMNHDLIAAGHPALRFDLLTYSENLPQHWDSGGEVETRFHESAVRVRGVGRAINLAAAASLSAERASDHLLDRSLAPWPELADYDCFACHQSLSMREYQTAPRSGDKSRLHVSDGLPVWNAWHTIDQLDLPVDPEKLRALLLTLSPHRSDPAKIKASGGKLATQYLGVAQARMTEPVNAQESLKTLLRKLVQQPPVDWHEAAVLYLEIDAALRDLARGPETAVRGKQFLAALGEVEKLLRFDPARAPGESSKYNSPASFDPDKFQQAVLGVFRDAATGSIAPAN
jgi:hypothetical protein